ncbi:MAG: type II toxin-antitoxin system VapC family toxin [Gemmatimonadaceae bacterium]
MPSSRGIRSLDGTGSASDCRGAPHPCSSTKSVATGSRQRPRRPRRAPARVREEPVGFRYLETSALLSALLEQDRDALKALRAPGRRLTSALTIAEAGRAVVRAHLSGRLTDDQARVVADALNRFELSIDVVGVSDVVLRRATRRFPAEPIRTPDAIHLATIDALGEAPALITVVTRDERIRANAVALGYHVE